MRAHLGWILLAALVVHAAAHVTIAARLLRGRAWKHAAKSFFLPPFAPLYGWRAGMRAPVYAWTGALAIYALGVAGS